MRTALIALSAAAVLTLSACGSDEADGTPVEDQVAAASPQPADVITAAPTPGPSSDPAAAASTASDVQAYAPALEQAFFANGYPQDLAEALVAAKKLTNLTLSPGNTIATYVYDPNQREFQLCIANTGGASATYDTAPMSTVATTKSGGCPAR